MAKKVNLAPAEEQDYSIKIYSEKLKKLARICPDDGQQMYSTGFMYLSKRSKVWYILYKCSKDNEEYWNRTPDIEEITRQIAKAVLEKGQNDES